MKLTIAVIAAALTFCGSAFAQTKPSVTALTPPPKTLLLVGNSFFYFNDSMHRYLGGLVIPAGLSFARSIAKNPSLNLYNADKRHPSLAGSYLGAATIYASLFGKSPAGLKYNGGLDDKTAAFLQETAWEAVKEYYGR